MCSSHAPEAGADSGRVFEEWCGCIRRDGNIIVWCGTRDRDLAEHGTPCLVCGAPILGKAGHDAGCMVARRAQYIADIRADIEAAGL